MDAYDKLDTSNTRMSIPSNARMSIQPDLLDTDQRDGQNNVTRNPQLII